ncbi:MAG TPA: serine O-acetyltransferase, partial [Cyanobacteria bacterium UBA8553]|nr:serine O-acetyltransferase [Cyanobacteria bacterium UBA8553]
SDCTVVGVPGRVIYRSGVRVNPLEHGCLPDSEAKVIRTLVDRIELLEQKLEELACKQPAIACPIHVESSELKFTDELVGVTNSSTVNNQIIQEFLNGAGI